MATNFERLRAAIESEFQRAKDERDRKLRALADFQRLEQELDTINGIREPKLRKGSLESAVKVALSDVLETFAVSDVIDRIKLKDPDLAAKAKPRSVGQVLARLPGVEIVERGTSRRPSTYRKAFRPAGG